ncbi:MAG TPA: hypothetical protein VEO74_14540, partial [Thermoanaerobaculia bacterium]|nr:hypothetical protein [Thermoanaerobaculia bacterium]
GSGQRDIWTIDPEAPQPKTTLVRLTSNPALHWNPVWSPDGKSLYFGSDRDGTLNLWRIAVDETTGTPAGEAEPLLLPASFSGHFAFSQQGEMVYTTLTRAFRLLAFPFDVKSGRIGAPRLLFGGSLEILTFAPSPDGQLIAFTTAGGQEDVFVARTDGTRLRQLTNDAAKDRIVTWSPDAKTLYFYSNRDGPYQIWSVNADGSGLARVTDEGDLRRKGAGMIALPNVSPDGRTLAAQTDRFAALVHLDRPLGSRLESLEHAIDMPTWSPDGKQLAGNVYKAPGGVVYSLQTGQAEKVLDRGANPLWLPDGRHLVVFEKGSVGIVDLDSRRMRTTPIALPPGVHFGGAGITHLSRDGSTLYLRQTLEQGDIWRMRAENRGHTR